jgi:hypothetical protein
MTRKIKLTNCPPLLIIRKIKVSQSEAVVWRELNPIYISTMIIAVQSHTRFTSKNSFKNFNQECLEGSTPVAFLQVW